MPKGVYIFRTSKYHVRAALRDDTCADHAYMDEEAGEDLDGVIDAYAAAVDARLETQAAAERADARRRLARVFRAFCRAVPAAADAAPPAVIYHGDYRLTIDAGGHGYSMLCHTTPSFPWMDRSLMAVRVGSETALNNVALADEADVAPWLRDLVREFGAVRVFDVFRRAYREPVARDAVEAVFARHGLDAPAANVYTHAVQDVPFAVVLAVDRARVVVFENRLGAHDVDTMTPWTQKLFERDDVHAILREIVEVL